MQSKANWVKVSEYRKDGLFIWAGRNGTKQLEASLAKARKNGNSYSVVLFLK